MKLTTRFTGLLFLLAILSLTGCRIENEVETTPQYIVGEWALEKVTINGISLPINDCIKRSYMTFSSNYDARSTFYTIYESSNECVLHLTHEGEWTYEDGTFYIIVLKKNNELLDIPERKPIHFIDADHLYTSGDIEGYSALLYFYKVE